jgi:hypothetical protein
MASPPTASTAPADRSRSDLWSWLALAPSLALVVLALAGPIASGDLWWHLRTGQWILDHGALPETDPFSHTAGDTHWILQEYLSQVLFALVHGALGFGGLRVLGAVLALVLLIWVQRIAARQVGGAWASLLTAAFAVLFALKWELRPHLLSAFLVLRLHALLFPAERRGPRDDPGPRQWIEVFALSALWVQLHAEALFAPIFALAGLLGAALAWVRPDPPAQAHVDEGPRHPAARVGRWSVVFLATLGGTLCSPLFVEPHVYALFKKSVPQLYIEEWFPSWVLPGDPRFKPLTVPLFAAVMVSFGWVALFGLSQAYTRLLAKPGFAWERIGFTATCLALAIDARRFFWLLWFGLLDGLALLLRRVPALERATWLPRLGAVGLAAVLAGTHFVDLALSSARSGRFADRVDDRLFPVHAAAFLDALELEGNLFHPYEWGGFLGYELGERHPTYIDGRTVLFEEVIPERWRAERSSDFAEHVFGQRDVRAIVFKHLVDHGNGPLPWRPPAADDAWIRCHADALAVVWLPRDAIAPVIRHWEAEGVAFEPNVGFLEFEALARHPEWQRERRLLPAFIGKELEPFLEAAADPKGPDARAWLHAARVGAKYRLGRNVRHALAQALILHGVVPVHALERADEARGAQLLPTVEAIASEILGSRP